MDEEWELMNEMEAEERGDASQPKVTKVLVEDSQVAEMPLGPDQGDASSGEASEADPGALDANGKPRKVWKKKGLKRQTRRVIMRPVAHKPKKATDAEQFGSDSEADVVEETQLDKPLRSKRQSYDDNGDDKFEDGATGSDYELDGQEPNEARSKKQKTAKRKDGKGGEQKQHDVEANKKPKKVNAQAHANFRKLKIKNKNSKANGRGKKFGRR